MRKLDVGELVLLAALWGASFLFMRLGAADFGAVALSGLRVAGASLVLLPLLAWRNELPALRAHWRPIFLVGVTNSALPFLCFSYAALTINAGLSSIFNAASPLFGALIAWLWLKDSLSPPRLLGLGIGFVGVFGLAYSKASLTVSAEILSTALAIGACIVATVAYGFSVNFTKRYLAGAAPMAVAAGSQLSAAIALAVPTVWLWPTQTPAASAWASLAALAVLCTGFAYILYFRLIAHVGPANAITVTFLIPAFAVAWSALFLDEQITTQMVIGCAVIFLGTALATGVIRLGANRSSA
jgi:drug/metabolite transporter (DMT)-like permease